MKKTAVLILYTDGWKPLADIVIKNMERYCDVHNYYPVFAEIRQDKYAPDFGFRKLEVMQLLFGDYDIIWSLDCDTLITNHNIPVEKYLTEDKNLYLCEDVNGINCGSFILKKSGWSLSLLKKCLSYRGIEGVHCEQDAINLFIKNYGDKNIRMLPHPSINSYLYELYPEHNITAENEGCWKPGNHVLHLPGVDMNKRLEIISDYKSYVTYAS